MNTKQLANCAIGPLTIFSTGWDHLPTIELLGQAERALFHSFRLCAVVRKRLAAELEESNKANPALAEVAKLGADIIRDGVKNLYTVFPAPPEFELMQKLIELQNKWEEPDEPNNQ